MKYRALLLLLVLLMSVLFLTECSNNALVALFTATPASGTSPLSVTFDASASYSSDGTVTTYAWDFGDGTSGVGAVVSHAFATTQDAVYRVTLTIGDNLGRTATTARNISVTGQAAALFFDDFEGGPDVAWASTDGMWSGSGSFGFYVPIVGNNDTGKAYITTGKNWTNYGVEVDVYIPGDNRSLGIILYAQQSLNSMFIVWANTGNIWWQLLENGEETARGESISPGLFEGWQHIKLMKDGGTYHYSVNDLDRLDISDTHFDQGMPGIAGYNPTAVIDPCMRIDNFRVVPN